MQELNLAYKYGLLYWNCANLVVDSGSLDEESNDSTNYGKMGTAIAKVQKENVQITLPLIESADFGFKPDRDNDRIIFGLKGINGINTELSQAIIENRPYKSIEDFAEKMLISKEETPAIIKKSQMIQLIKAGCFTELHHEDRKKTMIWYLKNFVFNPCNSLTLSQLPQLVSLGMITDEIESAYRMVNFKKYVLDQKFLIEKHIEPNKKIVKRGYHDGYYTLDSNSQSFFIEHFSEDSVIRLDKGYYVISEKKFIKEVDSYIQPLKDWMSLEETLNTYNELLFNQLYEENASGSISKWNMSALTFYEKDSHELQDVNEDLYGIVNYFNLPEEPEPYDYYTRYINGVAKSIPKYKISCIAGTVINADNNHHTVTLLTKYGPVICKINKGHYSYYNKRISKVGEDGKKHAVEDSWFKRGTLLRICGIKREDMFFPLNYSDTIYTHTINRINEVYEDGTLLLQSERTKTGSFEED